MAAPDLPSLPEPMVPADCDCTDLDGFMLNVERLMASELVALSTHEVVAAALFLWCRAWKQRPAASLPDDDRIIAAFARLPLPRFRKIRGEVMRGFVKCSDGRFYHRVLAAEAVKAYDQKKAFRRRREKDAERLRDWRASKSEKGDETRFANASPNEDETRFVAEGQGQGQVLKKDTPPPSVKAAPPEPGGGAGLDAQVAAMIATLDEAIDEHFGARRARPHAQDRAVARGWIEQGLSVDTVRTVIDEVVGRRAANGQDAPETLKFFIDPMLRAVAAGSALRDRMAPRSEAADPATAEASRRFVDAVTAWSRDGKVGPPPRREQYGLPPLDA
jgi:hypothetical protein